MTSSTNLPSDPLLADFLDEAAGLLDRFHDQLLTLEMRACGGKSNVADDRIDDMFRAIHSLKGLAGMFGLQPTQQLAHELESILAGIRERQLDLDEQALARMFEADAKLLQQLEHVAREQHSESSHELSVDDVHRALLLQNGHELPTAAGPRSAAQPVSPRTLRISSEHLECIDGLLDQLTATRTLLADLQSQLAPGLHAEHLQQALARLDRIHGEFRNVLADTRRTALSPVMRRLRRMVRDLARQTGKQIRLAIDGERIRLDKRLADPLSHVLIQLVQNAADHGIETRDERQSANKPPHGTINVTLSCGSDGVVLEVADDGRGLAADDIAARATAQGLFAPAQVQSLTHQQLLQLITEPGLSTARQVTGISGRGMGMNIVRSLVDELHGTLDVISTAGQGTVFRLCFPPELA